MRNAHANRIDIQIPLVSIVINHHLAPLINLILVFLVALTLASSVIQTLNYFVTTCLSKNSQSSSAKRCLLHRPIVKRKPAEQTRRHGGAQTTYTRRPYSRETLREINWESIIIKNGAKQWSYTYRLRSSLIKSMAPSLVLTKLSDPMTTRLEI